MLSLQLGSASIPPALRVGDNPYPNKDNPCNIVDRRQNAQTLSALDNHRNDYGKTHQAEDVVWDKTVYEEWSGLLKPNKLQSALDYLGTRYVFHPDNRVKKLTEPLPENKVDVTKTWRRFQ